MSEKSLAKNDRLFVRISPEVKELLAQKAAALGMNASEYTRLLILEDVRKDVSAEKKTD